jgi:hypothetical protein
MDLYFKITKGPRLNDVFKIQSGIIIGRGKAAINLKDSKASSSHGRIEYIKDGFYYLDLNSTNGSSVGGKKIQKVKIEPGLVIHIGASELEVITEFDLKKTTTLQLSEWREKLYDLLQTVEPSQETSQLEPFERGVYVRVTDGPFLGLEWFLGYGPRFLGPASTDLCLPDNRLPSLCIKILKLGSQIKIESTNQKKYVFDGAEASDKILQDKMVIALGENILEIGFVPSP